MPTYFQVVKKVLDGLYVELPAADRDQGISNALTTLGKTYETVLSGGGPDYSRDEVKFAYIFRYATAHADFLYTVIRQSPEAATLVRNNTHIVITCIGGGPGSDILGFVKWLLPVDQKPHLTFFLLDKDQTWSDAWCNLDTILESDLRTSNQFISIDVTDSATWMRSKAYLKADIYTLVYFLSEIYAVRNTATDFLLNTFSSMKTGAVLIVVDFHDNNLVNWIESIAGDCGLATKGGQDQTEWVIDTEEEKSDLGEYYTKFGNPKIRARLFYRIYVKE